MPPSGHQHNNHPAYAQINRKQIIPHFPRSAPPIVAIPLPQPSVGIRSPAFDHPVIEYSTGVQATDCECHGCAARAQINWEKIIPHLPRAIPAVVSIALP